MAKSGSRVTIIDIAKHANVSFKTVSRVLNDNPKVHPELRERVNRAIAELDYRPNAAARSLAGPRGYAIALLVSNASLLAFTDDDAYLPPFLGDLQTYALLACQEAGFRFFYHPVDLAAPHGTADLAHQLARADADGVLLAPPAADSVAVLDALDACGIPYVRFAPGIDLERAPSVAIDEYGGARAMTEHLLGLGHRRLGFITGPADHLAASARLTGFRDAIAACPDAAEPVIASGDFTFKSGQQGAEALLGAAERPTAIFAANDDMAAGVLVAAAQLGIRVPDALSVAGFDDSTMARLTWPPLTTVRQPIAAMARAAIAHIVAAAGGTEPENARLVLDFSIVERGSVGPA